MTSIASQTASLDPSNWDDLRALGHRMVDDMLGHLESIRDEPVWRPIPAEVEARLKTPLPDEGIGETAAYEEFLRDVLPYPVGNTHPRFWGWVIGSGTPLGAMAEFLAATMNPNVSGLQSSAPRVEDQVLGWLRQLLGFPEAGSGVLLSGGSMANLVGLAAGLQAKAGFDVGRLGLHAAPKPLVLYASDQTHFSVRKTARTLGLGTDALRVVPTDADYRIDLERLDAAIRADRADGFQPFAVVGSAGTTNTGAIDDLAALADLAGRENLWFHVDGAIGAVFGFVPELRGLVRGMERADSVAFDLHKWMVVPIEAGVTLVRDVAVLPKAFNATAGYVSPLPGGIGEDAMTFAERSPQLTRGFRALKIWMALKAYGIRPYADLVRRNVAQTRYLADRVEAEPALELLAPVPTNVVNYRYVVPGMDAEALNLLNRDILVRLQEDGIAAPSHTVLHGRFSLRVCIVNHRTRAEDLDLLVRETLRLGGELARSRGV